MIWLYSDRDLLDAVRQKRKILAGFLVATAIFVLGLIALTTVYCLLPYGDGRSGWLIAAASVLTGLYIIFGFPYMGISYKRIKAYCRMLEYLSEGLKEGSCLPFEGIEDWTTYDGVDVNTADFTVKDRKRDETMTRRVFIDGEKDFPPFEEGDEVRMICQGNLLIAYEVVKK